MLIREIDISSCLRLLSILLYLLSKIAVFTLDFLTHDDFVRIANSQIIYRHLVSKADF